MTPVETAQRPVRRVSDGMAVVFPDVLLVASREDPEQFRRDVLVATVGRLYQQGKISSGLGAQVLDCDRWEFFRLLGERGFPAIDYAEEDQEYEARTSREIAARLESR